MNIRWREWGQGSLRLKLISSVLIMTVPMAAMLLYNNLYAIQVVRGQVADSYKNMLTLYMNQIDTALNDIDAYMNSLAGLGYDLLSLSQAATDTEYYSAKVFLFNKLSKDISLYRSLDSFFVYTENRNDYMDINQNYEIAYKEKEAIQLYVTDLIHAGRVSKGTSMKRWTHHRIGEHYYLIDIVQSGSVYLGGWVRTDQLVKPLNAVHYRNGAAVFLADDQGQLITNEKLGIDDGIELHRDANDYYLTGSEKKYLVISSSSSKGSFNLVALIPDKQILANLPYLQWIIWLITFASLLFIPIGLYAIRRAILVPLYRMLLAMKKVRDGDWSNRVVLGSASREFKLLGDSFNAMMTEIETLRVNVYEEQLNKQREELQRLQLQVNPHFFLNSLNIVYNLAKVKNYELILEMTRSLVSYFRYMFRSNTSFVQLKDELEHTRNYLRIQALRFPGQLTWTIDAPDYVTEVPVPPLIIQSFVENSIKHAVTLDEPIDIAVQIDLLDDESGSRLKMSIKDTGRGFNGQVLRELQAGNSVADERGGRTGIWNVQRRLKLLYGEAVSIDCDNDAQTGGAAVEIVLPTNPQRGEAR